ncbi:MAG: ArnT family glycosyltransferase [Candidatus Hodarchaeota archaeon]
MNLTIGVLKQMVMARKIKIQVPYQIIFIVVLGFVARFLIAEYEWVNPDEGHYLYHANLILKGSIPFKDFYTREPIFIYLLTFFVRIFGISLLAGRLLPVVAGTISIYFVYLIGKELYSPNTGLLASLIFALSPYAVYYGSIIKLEPVGVMLITIAIYFLIIGIKNDEKKYFLLNGLFLGAAILTRRSSVIFLVSEPILLAYIFKGNLRSFLRKIEAGLIGVFLTFVLPTLYLISLTDFYWIWNALGIGEGILACQILGICTKTVYSVGIQTWAVKTAVIYSASTMLLYLLVPTFIFLALDMKKRFGNGLSYLAISGIGLTYLRILIEGASRTQVEGFGIVHISKSAHLLFDFLLILLLALTISLLIDGIQTKERFSYSNNVLLFWFISIAVFYLIWFRWFVDYFSEFIAVLSLMSSVSLHSIWVDLREHLSITFQNSEGDDLQQNERKRREHFRIKTRKTIITFLFFTLLVVSSLFTVIFVYPRCFSPYFKHEHPWPPCIVNEISAYLANHTSKNEEIFTGDTIFVSLADRLTVYNVSNPLYYYSPHDKPFSYDPYHLFPSITEIIERMETKAVKYVIVGHRTRGLFRWHPELERYVLYRYTLVKTVSAVIPDFEIKIYERNPD